MKVYEIGAIKHNAKKKENDGKLSKSDKKKLIALRKFKRNNS